MHEVVGELIVPNNFSKNISASSKKLLIKLFFKKKTALLVKLSVVPNKPLKPIDFSEKIRMILI